MGKRSKPIRRKGFDGIGESLWKNNDSWYFYATRLTELAISMFEWQNLPDTVDERYMELMLFRNGNVVFFKDDILGYLCLQCANNGYFDLYGIPKKRRAYAINGYQKVLDKSNSVIIYNNRIHTNGIEPVEYYARRLWDLDRTIDVNCRAQKTPVLLQCDENLRLSLENAYEQYDGNKPVVCADKIINFADALKVLKTDAPFVADKLYTYKTQLWNEALTALGISNVSFQKKERMLNDEVMRYMGGVIASRYSRLTMRRKAADEINNMFGLNISVDFRSDFREQDDEFMLEGDTGDDGITKMVTDLRTKGFGIGGDV